LSDPALATKALDRVRIRRTPNEYFQYLSVLFCSAQEIQTNSNLKSLPPTVVAHDLSTMTRENSLFKRYHVKERFKNYDMFNELEKIGLICIERNQM
ncbi:GSCOCG00003503001-RA-CDS, partial [Cotesia congregata]